MYVSRLMLAGSLLLANMAAAAEFAPSQTKEGLELFEKKIRPVLVTKCYECHSSSSKKLKGELLVDSREGLRLGGESGAAVVPGNPGDSLLLEALRHEGLEMPPKEQLSAAVIADFERWIELGAPDPRDGPPGAIRREIDIEQGKQHWAYQPPRAAVPPQTKNTAWAKTALDRFILARLEQENLTPVADADKVTLLRRVTFDLTGLPPTPEAIAALLADESSAALEKVVDRLLDSPQYGERWGRHWLDVARYGESTGKERNVPYHHAWRYRDWVIDAVNADQPYDQFLRDQIAGDLLPAASPAERNALLAATGFLAIGPKGLNEKNAEQYTMDVVDEQIDVVTRSVLATTVSCARCHDHKFDPIPTTDYYALAGIFKSTRIFSGVGKGSRNTQDKELLAMQPELAAELSADARAQIAALSTELVSVRGQLKTLATPDKQAQKKKARQQAKKAQKQGKPAPVESKQEIKAAALASTAELAARSAALESELKALGYESSASSLVMAVQEGKVVNCRVCIRGEIDDLGPAVPRGFVSVLNSATDPAIDPAQSGRLELAQWISSAQHPLTARVMVNRVWSHLFGQGIVATVDDFGALGERPTHPELLDHLALQFMQEGWSTKRLLRSIVLSRTYQLSSAHDDAAYAVDPANKLLWRASRRRLAAEAIRDAVLAASQQLDLTRPAASATAALANGEVGRGLSLEPLRQPSVHRSVYLPSVRGVMPEMLTMFDVADASLVVGQRDVTTVATQALYMMNSPFVIEHSEQTAKRLLATADDQERVSAAYLRILGRQPSASERQHALSFIRECSSDGSDAAHLSAWATLCQTLFATSEFRYVY